MQGERARRRVERRGPVHEQEPGPARPRGPATGPPPSSRAASARSSAAYMRTLVRATGTDEPSDRRQYARSSAQRSPSARRCRVVGSVSCSARQPSSSSASGSAPPASRRSSRRPASRALQPAYQRAGMCDRATSHRGSALKLPGEAVPHARIGADQARAAGLRLDLPPQVGDVHAQHLGVVLKARAPDVAEQRPVGEQAPAVSDQEPQQLELGRRQVHLLPGPPTRRSARSISSSPTVTTGSSAAGATRRSAARSRATSSSGPKGLVT